MRLFFSKRIPHFHRILLIESGSRQLMDEFLPKLARETNPGLKADVVTCFQGRPQGFDEHGVFLYQVADYAGSVGRKKLVETLRENRYDLIGLMCTEQPIMTKWKWMLAARVPAKLFIINENLDFFFVDYSNWKIIAEFALVRAGLYGASAVSTLGRAILLPFTLLYLLLFAIFVHLRRRVRA